MFLAGLSSRQKAVAYSAAFLSAVLLVAAPVVATFSLAGGIVLSAFLLLTSSAAAAILGERFSASLHDAGWFCPQCGEKLSLSDELEAFRLHGLLDAVQDGIEAVVLCPNRHRIPINATLAWRQMVNELDGYVADANGRALGATLSNAAGSPVAISEAERDFTRDARALLKHGDPGSYRYMTEEELLHLLSAFEHRPGQGLTATRYCASFRCTCPLPSSGRIGPRLNPRVAWRATRSADRGQRGLVAPCRPSSSRTRGRAPEPWS